MSHMNHSFIIQTAPRLNAFIRANQTALVMLYVLYCIVNIIWFWYSQKKKNGIDTDVTVLMILKNYPLC